MKTMNRSKDNSSKLNSVFYAHTYHPIQAGSIDGTDVLPHDNAVYRALLCSSTGLYDPLGDPSVIGEDPYCTLFVGCLSHLTTEDTLCQGTGDLDILVIIHMALPVDHKTNIIDGKLIAQTIRAETASKVYNLVEKYGKGYIELLKRSGVTIKGKRVVVVGRSNIVGLPVSLLLLKEDATVTVVHSRTTDPQSIICESDIVIAAAGQAMMVEFSKSKEGEYLKEEVKDVLQQGHSMFTEVENSLKKLENVFSGSMLQLQGSCKKLI